MILPERTCYSRRYPLAENRTQHMRTDRFHAPAPSVRSAISPEASREAPVEAAGHCNPADEEAERRVIDCWQREATTPTDMWRDVIQTRG